MTTDRIKYLFPKSPNRERLTHVLMACAVAAKGRADQCAKDTGLIIGLTDDMVTFSIDEVMHIMWNSHFHHRIYEVLATIESLKALNYVDDEDDAFEGIRLTNHLFSTLAEEFAYARGSRPHRVNDVKIFAPTLALACQIYERRLQRLKGGVVA